MNLPLPLPQRLETKSYGQAVETACRRIAPLFDVRDMVAVNPFLGFSELSFFDAALEIESLFHENILPYSEGAPKAPRVLCVTDRVEASRTTSLAKGPLDGLTRFLATYVAEIGADSPSRGSGSLFASYKRFATVDRTPEIRGLKGFQNEAKNLPSAPLPALHQLLGEVNCSAGALSSYLTRLLAKLPGYAGYLRGQQFSAGDTLGEMPELLTILLFQERALAQFEGTTFGPHVTEGELGYEEFRKEQLEKLEANEAETQRILARNFVVPERPAQTRLLSQAVFCIDVRSELLRSQLERWGDIETYGFAGFFGVPMSVVDNSGARPHCPPLLQPSLSFSLASEKSSPLGQSLERGLKAPVAALGHVEAFGLTSAFRLLRDAFPGVNRSKKLEKLPLSLTSVTVEQRTELARGILKNMGLERPLAPFVILAGHTSHVTNNPQAAGLACGACAGHGGLPNAQIAVSLLNDPEVRAGLSQTEDAIPRDVVFVAAEHETVTDSLRMIKPSSLSDRQKLQFEELAHRIDRASEATRSARNRGNSSSGASTWKRTEDYSETQPEWALAGNAAFVIGRRALSRQTDLKGRAFLHSYNSETDTDGSVLEMILTAPAVVGSWINLQYYASAVAPRTFGSGRKTLHNLTGNVGVVEGGSGDLAVGLSRESLCSSDGAPLVHQPERLHVIVQSDPTRIRAIIKKHETLRQLVGGGWIQVSALIALDSDILLEPITANEVKGEGSDSVAAE